MNARPCVFTASAVTALGTLGLLVWAWRSMRAAEALADSLKTSR